MGTQHDDDNDEFDTEIDGGADDGSTGVDGDEDQTDDEEDLKALTKRLQQQLDEYRSSNERMKRSLHRANREAAKLRHESKPGDDDSKAKSDEEVARWRRRSMRSDAKSVLIDSGAKPERLSSLVRMLDFEDVDYEGDDLVGLDEQIDDLRKSVPELFKSDTDDEETKPTKQRPSIRLAAGNRKSAGNQVDTADATTLQVRALRAGKV